MSEVDELHAFCMLSASQGGMILMKAAAAATKLWWHETEKLRGTPPQVSSAENMRARTSEAPMQPIIASTSSQL